MKTTNKIKAFILNGKLLFCMLLLICVKLSLAQAPPLGSIFSFGLFSSDGAINNLGPTYIADDVGVNVGGFNGFPPGTIVGQIHVADPVSVQAAIDLETAYAYLVGLTCDTVIGTSLGNNQVLTPNIYCLGAASTLNGDLILDGQGDPNALYIFKVDGALSTSVLSRIVLINSTSSSNIYWQVNGLFTLGDTSVFMGTIIVNAAITLSESSSVEGRVLSRTGAISLSNNTISIASSLDPLPIELIFFKSKCENQKAVLKWSTASETNNDYYLVERSFDGIDWKTIGIVDGSGNSNGLKNYSFIDEETFNDISYYRLKQTDFNETYTYSPIIDFKDCRENLTVVDIYPNPTNEKIYFLFNGDKELINSISIYNSLGEKVYHSDFYQPEINLSDKQEGIYYIHYVLTSETITKKLAIEKL